MATCTTALTNAGRSRCRRRMPSKRTYCRPPSDRHVHFLLARSARAMKLFCSIRPCAVATTHGRAIDSHRDACVGATVQRYPGLRANMTLQATCLTDCSRPTRPPQSFPLHATPPSCFSPARGWKACTRPRIVLIGFIRSFRMPGSPSKPAARSCPRIGPTPSSPFGLRSCRTTPPAPCITSRAAAIHGVSMPSTRPRRSGDASLWPGPPPRQAPRARLPAPQVPCDRGFDGCSVHLLWA